MSVAAAFGEPKVAIGARNDVTEVAGAKGNIVNHQPGRGARWCDAKHRFATEIDKVRTGLGNPEITVRARGDVAQLLDGSQPRPNQ